MKHTTKKVITVMAVLVLVATALSAKVSIRSTAGATRYFEMAVGSAAGGFLVDGVSAGVDALVDVGSDNKVSLEANAKKAADNSMSVLTFNASFYKDAAIMEDMKLFLESGVETHLVLSDGIGTELGLACKGGISYQASENFEVVMSAGVRNMFFSTACATMYSSVPSSVSMIGIDAGVECTYKF
ncbi:MAG: hypothetical protein MSS69_11670 [Spirochaetales bacterium]|nr:hypothetical protein [Spirochaetales bacterium]